MESLLKIKRESSRVNETLIRDHNPDAFHYIKNYINLDYEPAQILATATRFNVDNASTSPVENLVNLKRVNDTRFVNKFFEAANAKLQINGLYIGCFESKEQRKERIFRKFPTLFAYFFYMIDFMWKRVIPKLKLTKGIYFGLTKGHNRVLSVPEVLGRLVCCGFEIEDYSAINGMTYYTARKINSPASDNNPTFSPIISLSRIGYKGEHIQVHKVRTMHPYSEYLQEYVYEQNDLNNGDKFNDDFRVTTVGKFFRIYWLDELPMLLNLIKGELKLVGVRPLSRHKFNLYSSNLQSFRIKFKPGLLPPYYADMPESLSEVEESEYRYLKSYEKKPFRTDIKYFFKILYNILFKNARSR